MKTVENVFERDNNFGKNYTVFIQCLIFSINLLNTLKEIINQTNTQSVCLQKLSISRFDKLFLSVYGFFFG